MKQIKNIYIHFPFCYKKCHFCDFSVHSLNNKEEKGVLEIINTKKINEEPSINNYLNNLDIELKHFKKNYSNQVEPLETIYLGGGTPSLLNEKNLERLLKSIKENFSSEKNDLEITLEADPNTFNQQKLKNLYSMGISRINLGIQTFNENILKQMNRSHNLNQSFKAIEDLIDSDFRNNFGIELLQGLPSFDEQNLKDDLEEIVLKKYKNKIPHIAVSQLSLDLASDMNKNNKQFYSYEEIQRNNKLIGLANQNKFKDFIEEFKSDAFQDKLADYYTLTHEILTKDNNYDHYEITNYSLADGKIKEKKNYSKHNLIYLDGESEYVGFGPGSASFFMNSYFKKPQNTEEFNNFILNLKMNLEDHQAKRDHNLNKNSDFFINKYAFNIFDKEYFEGLKSEENQNQLLKFVLINQIRRKEGINLTLISDKFSEEKYKIIKYFFENKSYKEIVVLHCNKQLNSEYARLIFPRGALLLDHILNSLFEKIFKTI